MLNRRQFNHVMPVALAAMGGLVGCTSVTGESAYKTATQQTWRLGLLQGFQGATLGSELVRYAIGLGRSRPDLVIRFGRGPMLPHRCAGPSRRSWSEKPLRELRLHGRARLCVTHSLSL